MSSGEKSDESSKSKALRIAMSSMMLGDREQVRAAAKLASTSKAFKSERMDIKKQPPAIALQDIHYKKLKWETMLNGYNTLSKKQDYFKKELIKLAKIDMDMDMVVGLIKTYRINSLNVDNADEIDDMFHIVFGEVKIGDKLKNEKDVIAIMDAMTGGNYTGAYLYSAIINIGAFPRNKRKAVVDLLIERATLNARKSIGKELGPYNPDITVDEASLAPWEILNIQDPELYKRLLTEPKTKVKKVKN